MQSYPSQPRTATGQPSTGHPSATALCMLSAPVLAAVDGERSAAYSTDDTTVCAYALAIFRILVLSQGCVRSLSHTHQLPNARYCTLAPLWSCHPHCGHATRTVVMSPALLACHPHCGRATRTAQVMHGRTACSCISIRDLNLFLKPSWNELLFYYFILFLLFSFYNKASNSLQG